MSAPDGEKPTKWVGAAPVPPSGKEVERRRKFLDETLDLPAEPEPFQPPPPPAPAYGPPAAYGPPPGYGPPQGYGWQPPPRRRRRKWPWFLLIMTLLCFGCCGGIYSWARPYWQEYPAKAATSTPVTGLTKIDDQAATQTAKRLLPRIETDQLDEGTFTVVYVDAADRQKRAIVFGTTRFINDPERDLDAGLDRLGPDLALTGRRSVDPGAFGGYQRCANGKLDGRAITMCAWADHGSIAVALFTGARSLDAAATLTQTIRGAVISRD